MADSTNNFWDGVGSLLRNGADAYGNILQARATAEAARNMYGGHGGGFYGVDANGMPESYVNAPDVSARVPAWLLLAGVAGLVFVLARR